MRIGLTRNDQSSRLLRTVRGKRHASDEDHEEQLPLPKRRCSPVTKQPQLSADIDIDAEPMSSGDELPQPPPRNKQPLSVRLPSPEQDEPEEDELKAPPPKGTKMKHQAGTGAKGNAGKQTAAKGRRGADEDKENSSVGPSQASGSGASIWGMEHQSQKPSKRRGAGPKTFGKPKGTSNIHAAQPSRKNARPTMRVPPAHATNKKNTAPKPLQDDDSDSDCSMLSNTLDDAQLEELVRDHDDELPIPGVARKPKPKTTTSLKTGQSTPPIDPAEEDKELRRAPTRTKPKVSRDQIGDWMQQQAPLSSQPNSSAPQKDLDDLKDYIADLPQEDSEGTQCAICKTPVTPDDYWAYWSGKENKIKNQSEFCRIHKVKSAREEYASENLPAIDWKALPDRIGKHRMKLFAILNNKQASEYRDRYEPIALTGKAAAVPSRRKDLPEHVQEELDSYTMDDHCTYPGYYGPHGRRVITENVMRILKNEIKNCADAVVQGSGPATFVQAVLVPETAIMLIMEDMFVDREQAEEIRERTYEMGMLLNEEIEDQVEVVEGSGDEDEYFDR